jgi:hypothetical protein
MQTAPDETFVPLTPRTLSANERPDLRVTVVSKANAQSFATVEPKGSLPSMPQAAANEPRVALQHEGDRVSVIRIQCACGRTVELGCVYEDSPAQKSAPRSDPPAETESKQGRGAKS